MRDDAPIQGSPQTVAEIAAASGREIAFQPVTIEQYAGMLAEHDVPAEVVSMLTYLFTEVLDGRNATLADGVQRALRRPARDFHEYARFNAATGIWTPTGPTP